MVNFSRSQLALIPPRSSGNLLIVLSVSPHSGAVGLVQCELPTISQECWPFVHAVLSLDYPDARRYFSPKFHGWLGPKVLISRIVLLDSSLGGHLAFQSVHDQALPALRLTGESCHISDHTVPRQDVNSDSRILPLRVQSSSLDDRTHVGFSSP